MRRRGGQWQIRDLRREALVAVQVGAVLVFAASFVMGGALRGLLGPSQELSIAVDSVVEVLAVPISIVAVILLHELVHAALFALAGGRPRFGAKLIGRVLPVVYATSTVHLSRDRYLLVCLGPFVALTLGCLLIGILASADNTAALALLLMALNAGGSVGDFVTAWQLVKHERATTFQDTEDGFIWMGSCGD